MNQFLSSKDVPSISDLLAEAKEVKANPFAWKSLGKNKSVCLLFLNPSLRTRLSSQRAAANLGLEVVVLDVNSGSWKLEFADGVVMNGDSAEHVKEAAGVIGAYFDVIAIRAFAELKNKEEDNAEKVLSAFVKYCGVPVINMESSTGHPLQALADLVTIEENKKIVQFYQNQIVLHQELEPHLFRHIKLGYALENLYSVLLSHQHLEFPQ